jgi:flagellar protein FliO/FliZ
LADILLAASTAENFYRFLVALIIFIVVLFATYYVSQWAAGYQKIRMTNRNFEVIDSLRVGNNKYMMIVRIGRDRYFAVGVGKDEFTLLGELDGEQVIPIHIDADQKSGRAAMTFASLLEAFKQDKETSDHHEE